MSDSPDLELWRPLLRSAAFEACERHVRSPERALRVAGLADGARALVLSLLAARAGRRLLIVTPDDATLEGWRRDLFALSPLTLSGANPAERIAVLPALEADPYDGIAPHPEVLRERVIALDRLLHGTFDILLTPVRALLQPLPTPGEWDGWTRRVDRDDTLPPDRFILDAMALGYRRVDVVAAPGEVSRRGGILDIFPPTAAEPVRIELFGDTVDSLRSFDTDHQRSTGALESTTFGPATERPPTERAVERVRAYLEGGMQKANVAGESVRPFREHLEQLAEQGYWPGFECLARIATDEVSQVFDHAGDALLVVDEPERTAEELARAWSDAQTTYENSEQRVFPPPSRLLADPVDLRDRLATAPLELQELISGDSEELAFSCRSARAYGGRIGDVAADLRAAREETRRTVCLMRARGGIDRLREILGEYDLEATPVDRPAAGGDAWTEGGLFVAVGSLRTGFEFPSAGLQVLAEQDLFGQERERTERKHTRHAAFVSDFRDLKVGSRVVHVDHGVAVYRGLGRPKGGSLNRDFMVLEFAGGDRLFVPVDRLDLVQKYSGVAGKQAQLDRLGGPSWERVKRKVRKSVESMAKELLALYAQRHAATGHAFSKDTPWQAELEAAFPYELTDDQQRAVEEIKSDMESPKPADRLLVGDVGFGKTEVAVRAAFKAVMDGRQVAILAPTTVLAFQHYRTFCERFSAFPVRVEMVSRFRSAAEVKKVLQDAALGAVDVIIGTHRMLSKDVEFRRLGLLVVDEEQRFGVRHKERLKKMSIGVDVLAMTATPIPRTLQMSMAGVRDMSVIQTPPPGRMAIQTYLVPYRPNVLAQAIRQELRRDGQVFVVHNRVETLPSLTKTLTELVPDARVLMAHGQMGERKLEDTMMKFARYEADVLATTTIIENGLDIPRANTIIVNRADHFGLAQLYQLRGRVGRSEQHAYAYFVVPSRHTLSDEARKRLRALQEFSELGSGFRLAAADLEIRGAGELLGSRQHGHIASLGFDLYCQMLERAVNELRGEPLPERKPVNLHLGVDIKIEESFLAESADRLVVYKRLAQATESAEIEKLRAEIEDRYGHLPPATRNLFEMGRLRLVAESAGVKSVDLVEDKLQIRFHDEPPIEPTHVLELVARERGSLSPSGRVTLPAPPRDRRIESVRDLLERMLTGKSSTD